MPKCNYRKREKREVILEHLGKNVIIVYLAFCLRCRDYSKAVVRSGRCRSTGQQVVRRYRQDVAWTWQFGDKLLSCHLWTKERRMNAIFMIYIPVRKYHKK